MLLAQARPYFWLKPLEESSAQSGEQAERKDGTQWHALMLAPFCKRAAPNAAAFAARMFGPNVLAAWSCII
eukprot:2637437-Amphidinium_carterae.1